MSQARLTLQKGGRLTLDKSLDEVTLGLGWKPRVRGAADIDPDASAFALRADNKVPSDYWFIYFNQKSSPDADPSHSASIRHAGDDRGSGDQLGLEEDSEQIRVSLTRVPPDVVRIVFVVTIYNSQRLRQNFGMLADSYIRLFDTNTGETIGRYDLKEDFGSADSIMFGELRRERRVIGDFSDSGTWHFVAIGESSNKGLQGFCNDFGVVI